MGRSVVNISFGGGLSQNWSRLQSLNENEMLSIDSCRRESLCSSVRRGRTTSAQSVKLRPENAQCSLTPLLPPPFLYLLSSLLLLHFTLHFFTPFSLALDAKITIPKFPSGLIKYPSIYLSVYLSILSVSPPLSITLIVLSFVFLCSPFHYISPLLLSVLSAGWCWGWGGVGRGGKERKKHCFNASPQITSGNKLKRCPWC